MNERRETGSFYTSVDNIHRVIDLLILNDLRAELDQCGADRDRLIEFQAKLSRLTFLDPACGSGNFLVETFLSLRRIENKIIDRVPGLPTRVSLDQFFGIENNPDAVSAARTHFPADHIVEGNALTLDWRSIIPTVDFIIGNPPFIGASMMSAQQKSELVAILGEGKLINSVDYVGGWFHTECISTSHGDRSVGRTRANTRRQCTAS